VCDLNHANRRVALIRASSSLSRIGNSARSDGMPRESARASFPPAGAREYRRHQLSRIASKGDL